tara:strand:- start:2986 stop:3651 length:666 start_codon:yes stop_codon:yes gene_type:complete
MKFNSLEEIINYKFRNKDLLEQSLTHSSHEPEKNNERLEFLGDSIISLVVSKFLSLRLEFEDEGRLSIYRSKIVSRENLSKVASDLKLENYLITGTSFKNNNNKTNSILGNAFEALMGAVFLDSNYEQVEKIILFHLNIDLINLSSFEAKDPKTLLQEKLQSLKEELAIYSTEEMIDPAEGKFLCRLSHQNLKLNSKGIGSSKKTAEQHAAKEMLLKINES